MITNRSNILPPFSWKGIFILFLFFICSRSSTALSPNSVFSAYVYPNPVMKNMASGIHIDAADSEFVGISIFTVDGEKIFEAPHLQPQGSFDLDLNIGSFKSGVYTAIVRFVSVDNSATQKRFQFTVIK